MGKRKKELSFMIFSIIILFVSCKNEIKPTKKENIQSENYEVIESVLNQTLDQKLVIVINQENEFKISCATKSNVVKLDRKSLYLEIVEPINYEIKKIEESNSGFKVYFKDEDFFYDVSLIDKNRGILYWKNLSSTQEIDNDYSFYTVNENNLSTINLKEDCEENSDLIGESEWKVMCSNSDKYFIYSEENNEGSLSGMLKKDYSFSITGSLNKKKGFYEFRYSQNYNIASESESEQFWNNFSKKEKIAEIKVIDSKNIEFTWLGFYNTKTKKREFLENPFTGKVEQSSIILKKCDE